MRRIVTFLLVVLALLAIASIALDRTDESDPSLGDISTIVESVRMESFPQLRGLPITLHTMTSDYIYLESRFTLPSFFTANLRYMILYNREATARHIPADALRAIAAHELAHVDYFQSQSRMGLVSLVRLLSVHDNAQFERTADLETIGLGYGPGLRTFRVWLYQNIPASRLDEKKRDYFSPPEIDAILDAERKNPRIAKTFSRCIPMNLEQIQEEARDPEGVCPR